MEATIIRTRNSLRGHKDSVKCLNFLNWQKVSAQADDQYWMREFCALSTFGVGNQTIENDRA